MRAAIRSETHPDSRLQIRIAKESDRKIVGNLRVKNHNRKLIDVARSKRAKPILFVQPRGRPDGTIGEKVNDPLFRLKDSWTNTVTGGETMVGEGVVAEVVLRTIGIGILATTRRGDTMNASTTDVHGMRDDLATCTARISTTKMTLPVSVPDNERHRVAEAEVPDQEEMWTATAPDAVEADLRDQDRDHHQSNSSPRSLVSTNDMDCLRRARRPLPSLQNLSQNMQHLPLPRIWVSA